MKLLLSQQSQEMEILDTLTVRHTTLAQEGACTCTKVHHGFFLDDCGMIVKDFSTLHPFFSLAEIVAGFMGTTAAHG